MSDSGFQSHQKVSRASRSMLFAVLHRLISVFTFSSLLIPQAFPQFKALFVSFLLKAAFSDNASVVCIDLFLL